MSKPVLNLPYYVGYVHGNYVPLCHVAPATEKTTWIQTKLSKGQKHRNEWHIFLTGWQKKTATCVCWPDNWTKLLKRRCIEVHVYKWVGFFFVLFFIDHRLIRFDLCNDFRGTKTNKAKGAFQSISLMGVTAECQGKGQSRTPLQGKTVSRCSCLKTKVS